MKKLYIITLIVALSWETLWSKQKFVASLSGLQEVPSINTRASGELVAELFGNELTISGSFSDLEGEFDETIAGGAYLHLAGLDANGGVDLLLNAFVFNDSLNGLFLPMDNTNTLDSD